MQVAVSDRGRDYCGLRCSFPCEGPFVSLSLCFHAHDSCFYCGKPETHATEACQAEYSDVSALFAFLGRPQCDSCGHCSLAWQGSLPQPLSLTRPERSWLADRQAHEREVRAKQSASSDNMWGEYYIAEIMFSLPSMHTEPNILSDVSIIVTAQTYRQVIHTVA